MTELIIAADVSEEAKLGRLMVALKDQPVWLKVGLEALSAFGLDLVRRIRAEGFKVFADVKFHDIPNTVGAASKVLAATGANLFNVHCSGGRDHVRGGARSSPRRPPPRSGCLVRRSSASPFSQALAPKTSRPSG